VGGRPVALTIEAVRPISAMPSSWRYPGRPHAAVRRQALWRLGATAATAAALTSIQAFSNLCGLPRTLSRQQLGRGVHLARDAQNSADTNQNVFDSFLENFDYADEPPKPAETENTDAVIEADVIETTDVAATQSQPFDSFDTSASVNQVADEEADVQSYSSTDDTWGVASTAVGPDDFQSPSPTFQEDLVGAPQPGAVGTSPVPEEAAIRENELELTHAGIQRADAWGENLYVVSAETIHNLTVQRNPVLYANLQAQRRIAEDLEQEERRKDEEIEETQLQLMQEKQKRAEVEARRRELLQQSKVLEAQLVRTQDEEQKACRDLEEIDQRNEELAEQVARGKISEDEAVQYEEKLIEAEAHRDEVQERRSQVEQEFHAVQVQIAEAEITEARRSKIGWDELQDMVANAKSRVSAENERLRSNINNG